MLSGGAAAIAKLAREEGSRYPRAYVDWIKALEKDGDFPAMLQAAREGLANVARDRAVRAEIAEGMVRAGEGLRDTEVQLAGWREAFYSSPSLSHLLSLLSAAKPKGRYGEEIEAVISRIASLLERRENRKGRAVLEPDELRESTASGSLLNQSYLLAGRHQDAFNLCRRKEGPDWIDGYEIKELAIPFFLALLSGGKDLHSARNLEQLWKEAVGTASRHSDNRQAVAEGFERAMGRILPSIPLSEEEQDKYLRWCTEETGCTVDHIVGQQLRGNYGEAATQLVALAETLAARNMKSKGVDVIDRYRQKYRHHSAFKKELNAAMSRGQAWSPRRTLKKGVGAFLLPLAKGD
ncbi:MAG: hypothetical protein HY673_08560 [Chloroflexi bacterium]|nr:hypothetical protein [Chloroflexota bacterium]